MENDISYSPSARKEAVIELTFCDALKKMLEGKKVSKREWENTEEYGFFRAEILHIHRSGQDHRWVLSEADVSGEDYFIVEEI